MVTRVAVIGAGGMGAWFARFFKSRGDHVTISDRDSSKARRLASKLHAKYASSNVEAARRSEIIILATPANVISKVINEILPTIGRNALVCDVCATKSAVMPGLRAVQRRGIKVASIHPMFGPLARGIRGRKIIAIRTGKDTRGSKMMKRLLEGAHIFLTRQDIHDTRTAVTLGLPHFLNMAFAMTVTKRGDLAEIRRFAGRTFNLQLLLAEAIADEPETTADIQTMNREFSVVLRDLQRNIQALAKIVNKQDRAKLVARYKQVRKALSVDPEFRTARTAFEKVAETQSAVSRR
jgi:prephenate dehydrogenase